MPPGPLTEEAVRRTLDGFQDPETGRGVVTLQQVHDLKLDAQRLSFTLGLTSFVAPVWEQTRAELVEFLQTQLPSLREVTIDLTEHQRAAQKIGQVGLTAKAVIAVSAGKGGVGKSTIALTTALGLVRAGCKVGLLDADLQGPSIPHLLGTNESPREIDGRVPPITVDGLKIMSMGLLVPADEAVVWRGPMLHGAVQQFLRDIDWGDLDYLIVDMPPGTGDVGISLSQLVPMTGAIIVCTPQQVALLDAVKAIAMFRKMEINVLGMVENMSHFVCTKCDARHEIFGSGGARRKANELNVPFLGEVPINIQLRTGGDSGTLAAIFDDPLASEYLTAISTNLVKTLVEVRRKDPPMPSLTVLK